MILENCIKLIIRLLREIKIIKIFEFAIAFSLILQLCSCNKPIPNYTIDNDTIIEIINTDETTNVVSSVFVTSNKLQENSYSDEASLNYNNKLFYFLKENLERFNYAQFSDIDLDGNIELLFAESDLKSFETSDYYVYKLNNDIPQLYGMIALESSTSRYAEHTVCGGKLQRYYDSEKGVYIAIGDETHWDDGNFGQIQYNAIEYVFYSDKIYLGQISSFSGTDCCPAEYIRSASDTNFSPCVGYVYSNGVFDLNSTEKFTDILDIVSEYEWVNTLDLNSLDKYTDIDKIMTMIKKYSGYDNVNAVLSPKEIKEYIDVLDMSGDKICKSDTYVSLLYSNNIVSDLDKVTELENLQSINLYYWSENEIEIDLSPLKKCKNLMSISLPQNISESTKRQISEFKELRYVNANALNTIVSNAYDFEYLKDLPYLKYIAVASDNDDPDYFNFLYDNKSLKWIRFDKSVTDEQIKNTVENMPNLEAVTFGFSEV